MFRKHREILIGGTLLVVLAGCGRLNPQSEAEARFAGNVVSWMKDYDIASTNTSVTNLVTLFSVLKHRYPYGQHQDLARYGKHSGFTNSLAEKYVFFSPRITHKSIEGEAICMNAQPFPRADDGLWRIYIARSGSNYIYRMLPESAVETVLKEARPSTVARDPAHRPPPPPPEVQEWLNPPLRQRYDRFARDLSGAIGLDSHDFVRIALPIAGALLLMSLTWVTIHFWRRRHR